MNTFLITFQIVSADRSEAMINCIKEYGIWARITPSSWCIKANNLTTAEIRDSLNSKCPLQNNERLMVINVTNAPWASYYLPKEVTEWLKEDK